MQKKGLTGCHSKNLQSTPLQKLAFAKKTIFKKYIHLYYKAYYMDLEILRPFIFCSKTTNETKEFLRKTPRTLSTPHWRSSTGLEAAEVLQEFLGLGILTNGSGEAFFGSHSLGKKKTSYRICSSFNVFFVFDKVVLLLYKYY